MVVAAAFAAVALAFTAAPALAAVSTVTAETGHQTVVPFDSGMPYD
jgi:hypothetical protein